MNLPQLKRLIKSGESETLEFKITFSKDVIESVSAFANTKGGRVIIGVSNNGGLNGVSIGKESLQEWINEIKQSTLPSIIPEIQTFTLENKNIAVISINEFPVKPVAYKDRYYKRIANSNHRLSVQEITDIHLQSLQLSWDSYISVGSQMADIDPEKAQNFIQKIKESGRFAIDSNWKTVFEKLMFIKDNRPTNAAILLFGIRDCPHTVHIGRFKSASIIIDDRVIRGTLFTIVNDTMKFIMSHLKVAFSIAGSKREEIYEYPISAIRELLHNAIVHREYTSPVDIQIKIFDNAITFFNPGILYGNITIQQLERDDYQSRIRNKLIAEAFYLTRDIEKYGSGFIRIRNALKNYPTMKFECEIIGEGFLAKLSYEKQKTEMSEGIKTESEGIKTGPEGIIATLNIIEKNPGIRIPAISQLLALSSKSIERWIGVLRKQEAIEYRGSKKTGGYFKK